MKAADFSVQEEGRAQEIKLFRAEDIRSEYTIGYSSSNPNRDGGFRRVKIVASRNGGRTLKVTTREGYTAPTDQSISR